MAKAAETKAAKKPKKKKKEVRYISMCVIVLMYKLSLCKAEYGKISSKWPTVVELC